MTTGKKAALNVIFAVYLAGVVWLAYEIIADPDLEKRKLQRLNVRYRAYQSLAEHFGRLGMEAEKAYLSTVEGMRTI